MTIKGQDSRGDAALREATATGQPVPTSAEQAGELFPFPINCIESNNSNFVHLEHGITGEQVATFNKGNRATRVRNAEFAMDAWNKAAGWEWCGENGVDWKRVDTAARDDAFNALHAYAKAEELRAKRQWVDLTDLLTSCGWDGESSSDLFIDSLRTSALAKAGGTNV